MKTLLWHVNTITLIAFMLFASYFFHESVHYVQARLDPRVEPKHYVVFFGDGWWEGMQLPFCWTTDNVRDMVNYKNEVTMREIVAYSLQTLFVLFFSRLVFSRKPNV